MANSYSFRSGQRELVKCPVDSGTVVEVGDVVYLETDDTRPASSKVWDTNLATTQANLANVFMGVAVEMSANGDTDDIDVDISPDSVYQFTVNSATYKLGDALGCDKDTGNALLDQALEAATGTSAIARAKEFKSSATTLLRVSFASAYNVAANNVNAVVG